MNILFIHQNFPGQFIHLSEELARRGGNRVVALTMRDNPAPKGVIVRKYSLLRRAAEETHPMLRDEEAKVMRAEACASAAFQLKHESFVPDVIVAHPGWGEALFIKDVFPTAKLVLYCEYYYATEGQDVGFDPEEPPLSFQQRCSIRLKNTTNLLSLEAADAAIAPTQWQKSTFPAWAQDKISVIHDGIDHERLKFNPKAQLTIRETHRHPRLTFKPGDEVLSYVARNLEPVRGFHMLMRTLPAILKRRKHAHVLIVGGDEISYGRPAPGGLCWREHMLAEVGDAIDLSRVHFVGKVPYRAYLDLLSISRVHTYWTTPFVLSWSFLESALSGLPLIASATQPVQEFSELLGIAATVDFFNAEGFARNISAALARSERTEPKHIRELTVQYCVPQQVKLISSL